MSFNYQCHSCLRDKDSFSFIHALTQFAPRSLRFKRNIHLSRTKHLRSRRQSTQDKVLLQTAARRTSLTFTHYWSAFPISSCRFVSSISDSWPSLQTSTFYLISCFQLFTHLSDFFLGLPPTDHYLYSPFVTMPFKEEDMIATLSTMTKLGKVSIHILVSD